ncbi:hypothetical protein K438DRAFT_1943379 [Mycena galopus ATCC 62051]|nr:hypothetical protein K438DRAFT_1943379 [Mycena galopus ATCC 62051]
MPFKESSADLEARNYKQSAIHLKKDSRSRCGVHVSFGLPAEVVRRKWASRIGREACGRNMCREVPGACILEGSCKVGEERGVPVTLTLDIPVPSGGFWYGYSAPNRAPELAFGPRHCLLSERNTDCGGTGKLKKLATWCQEGQLRQFRQHAPAVRRDEEMEAEENERRWRRNALKYRLQASNWQMVRCKREGMTLGGGVEHLERKQLRYRKGTGHTQYSRPMQICVCATALQRPSYWSRTRWMPLKEKMRSILNQQKEARADKRGRAVDTTGANSLLPQYFQYPAACEVRVQVCGEIERWSNSKALCGTQGNNLISSRIQWQVEINKWISNTRATEFEDKDIEEEEEEPTLVPNPTRAPPKIKN